MLIIQECLRAIRGKDERDKNENQDKNKVGKLKKDGKSKNESKKKFQNEKDKKKEMEKGGSLLSSNQKMSTNILDMQKRERTKAIAKSTEIIQYHPDTPITRPIPEPFLKKDKIRRNLPSPPSISLSNGSSLDSILCKSFQQSCNESKDHIDCTCHENHHESIENDNVIKNKKTVEMFSNQEREKGKERNDHDKKISSCESKTETASNVKKSSSWKKSWCIIS